MHRLAREEAEFRRPRTVRYETFQVEPSTFDAVSNVTAENPDVIVLTEVARALSIRMDIISLVGLSPSIDKRESKNSAATRAEDPADFCQRAAIVYVFKYVITNHGIK